MYNMYCVYCKYSMLHTVQWIDIPCDSQIYILIPWLLLGRETLRLQGLWFPEELLATFTDKFLRDLAGNAFASPVCCACALALMVLDSFICAGNFPSARAQLRRVARPFAALNTIDDTMGVDSDLTMGVDSDSVELD